MTSVRTRLIAATGKCRWARLLMLAGALLASFIDIQEGPLSAQTAQPLACCQAQAEPPHLSKIVPSSGPAGGAYPIHAVIVGTHFMPTGNVIQFGPVKISGAASADGTHIAFLVPKLVPSRGEASPAVLTTGE